jgi:hypothetical protein
MHGVIDTRPAGECRARLLLAHGAGAPMDSDFMNAISDLLAGQGIAVRRFEFPYMQKRREDGRKRPPDRAPALLAAFAGQLAGLPDDVPVLVGGGGCIRGRPLTRPFGQGNSEKRDGHDNKDRTAETATGH